MFTKLHLILTRYHELLYALAQKDLTIRYKGSYFGYLWAFMEPLFLMLIYTFVFSIIIRISVEGIPYPLFILSGILPWVFFSSAITHSVRSITKYSKLIKKIYFPREIFPISTVLSRSSNFLVSLLLLVIFALLYRYNIFSVNLLFLPVVVLIHIIFSIGIGFIVGALNVFYKDVELVTTFILRLWFYASPIIYSLGHVPPKYLNFYVFNPMVGIIEMYRAIFLYRTIPDPLFIAMSSIYAIAFFCAGYALFSTLDKYIGDVV